MSILCLYCISPIIIPFGLGDLLLGIICKELYVLLAPLHGHLLFFFAAALWLKQPSLDLGCLFAGA